MKIIRLVSAIAFCSLVLSACSDYNKTEVKDDHEGEERIYGNIDGPPRQMANKYEAKPESAERARKIREILYPTK